MLLQYATHKKKLQAILSKLRIKKKALLTNKTYSRDVHRFFNWFAQTTSEVVGSPIAFLLAVLTCLAWFVTGPIFHFSDTWQLIISSITNIVTFVVVFLIQYAQNKDTKALHLKLDELIRIHKDARNKLVKIEQEPEEELDKQIEEISTIVKEGEDTTPR